MTFKPLNRQQLRAFISDNETILRFQQMAQLVADSTTLDVSALEARISTLEGEMTVVQGQIITLQAQVSTLQAQVAALETISEDLESLIHGTEIC